MDGLLQVLYQKKKKGQVNHKDKDFIPGLNFIFFCLIGLFVMVISLKQRKENLNLQDKIKPQHIHRST